MASRRLLPLVLAIWTAAALWATLAQADESNQGDAWPVFRGDARASGIAEAVAQHAPGGVDAAFECSGDPACLDQAVEVLSPGGTLVLAGIPAPDRVSFDIHTMRRKELRLSNVRRQCGCVGPVIEMIGAGRLDARPLRTHRFPLETIGDAFELVAGRGDGVVKAVIELSCR